MPVRLPAAPFLLVALLASQGGSAVGWTQDSFDAARTSFSPGPAPAANDTAWLSDLPGLPPRTTALIVVGDAVHVLVEASPGNESVRFQGVVSLDLASGAQRWRAPLDAPLYSLAFDGRLLLGTDRFGLVALDPRDGSRAWSLRLEDEGASSFKCVEPAIAGGVAYLACSYEVAVDSPGAGTQPVSGGGFVSAVALDEPRELWRWYVSAQDTAREAPRSRDPRIDCAPYPSPEGLPAGGRRAVDFLLPSVVGNGVYVVAVEFASRGSPSSRGPADVAGGMQRVAVHARDRATGEPLWVRAGDVDAWGGVIAFDEATVLPPGAGVPRASLTATGAENTIYLKLDTSLVGYNAQTGACLLDKDLGNEDVRPGGFFNGLALHGNYLYSASNTVVYALELSTREFRWRKALPLESGDALYYARLLVADGKVIANAVRDSDRSKGRFYVLDERTGEILWTHSTRDLRTNPVLGDGLLLYTEGSRVVALGEGRDAPRPRLDASTAYPAPGETVLVDVADAAPGAEFRVDWGDGNLTEWGRGTRFSHAFASAGDRTVRAQARDASGRTGSAFVAVHVGGSPPASWLSDPFAPDHVGDTLQVLGMGASAIVVVAGLAVSLRKRRLLRREIDAIDAIARASPGQPDRAAATLVQKRRELRARLRERRLDENHYALLREHLEEHLLQARRESLLSEFRYAPLALYETLRRGLEDGRLTESERGAFLYELERAPLVEEEKARLRAVVDRWIVEASGPPPARDPP